MIAVLKPYPDYKESGSPWLGQVPRHWEVSQARHIGRLFKAIGGTKEDAVPVGVPCVRYGELYTTYSYVIHTSKASISPELVSSYTPIQYGDVLFAASGETTEDIGKSAVNLIPTTAVCGGDIIILRPSIPVHAPFLGYAMDSRPVTNQKAMMGRGTTVKHIYPDELKNLLVPLPPLDEQEAIVRFIRHLDQRVNRLITAKRRLIALLNEQKQAVIHRAVTRGLDPTVPLKPSDIDWLGNIPIHWEVRRLKFVASCIVDCLHATPPYSDSGAYPAIRTADISPGIVHVAKARKISWDDYVRWTARLEPREGDILYSREGERFGIAACVPANTKLCISQRMMVFRIADNYCPSFVMNRLNDQSTYMQALQDVMGATAPHINVSTIRNYFLALPPSRDEQEAIVSHIESDTSPMNIAISRLEREIDLIREYRTRLIADVVTGQLDVRHLDLPDLDDEPMDLADESDDVDALAGEELAEVAL